MNERYISLPQTKDTICRYIVKISVFYNMRASNQHLSYDLSVVGELTWFRCYIVTNSNSLISRLKLLVCQCKLIQYFHCSDKSAKQGSLKAVPMGFQARGKEGGSKGEAREMEGRWKGEGIQKQIWRRFFIIHGRNMVSYYVWTDARVGFRGYPAGRNVVRQLVYLIDNHATEK